MAVKLGSTGIQFPNGTIQTTAITNNNQLTNGAGYITSAAPDTAQVLNATASASTGAVGTYALLYTYGLAPTAGNLAAGGTIAGSFLRYSDATSNFSGTPGGTWRAMGFAAFYSFADYGGSTHYRRPTLYLRVT